MNQSGAGVQLDHRLRMSRRVRVQAAQEAQFIDVLRGMRIKLRHPRPGLAVLRELELRGDKGAAAGADLAVLLLQARLVLPGVHLRDGPLHEEEDDALRLRLEVRLLRGQRLRLFPGGASGVLAEHASQGEVAEAGPDTLEGVPSRKGQVSHGGSSVDGVSDLSPLAL